ncbi:hypothetical protein N7513_012296 [Penicillium frequentans]|nr:hypothetical protein N7513_012296 [Penicillium glabrum]
MRTAVALSKERQSPFLGPALGNLAALLLEQSKSTGRDAGLNEALQMAYWALDCLSDGDAARAPVLATLGIILFSQYDCLSRLQDLEDAIYSLQIAIQTRSLPGDGAFSAAVLNNLACALGRRYEYTGRREDLNDAITSALEATQIELSDDPNLMAAVGSNLANLLARQYGSIGEFDSLSNALFEARIVTEVAPEMPQLDALLGHIGGLAEGQQALRAQATTKTIGVSRWRYLSFEDIQNDMDTLSRGVNQIHCTPLSQLRPVFTESRIKCNEDGLESQKQLPYDIREHFEPRSLTFQSSNESECSVTLLSAPEEEESVSQINETPSNLSSFSTKRMSPTGNSKKTDTTFPAESTGAWDKQEPILDNAIDQEDKSPFTEVSSLKAEPGPVTITNQTHQSHPDVIPTEDALCNLSKDPNDKVHGLMRATKVDEESSSFEVVAQGNTSNDMKKNEGNAMGNIYSEEAHVVGHLSRHYGDKFEMKNISATLHGHRNSGADRISPDATTKKLHAEDISQDSEDEYSRGLDKGLAIERLGDYQVVPQHRNSDDNHPGDLSPEPEVKRSWGDISNTMTWPGKGYSLESSNKASGSRALPPKPQIRQNRSYYDQSHNYRKPSESGIDSDDATSGHPMIHQVKRPTPRRAFTPSYPATSETAYSSDFPSDVADNGRYYPSNERWPAKSKYRLPRRPKSPLEWTVFDDYPPLYSLGRQTAAQEQIKHSKSIVPIKPIVATQPERRNNGRIPAKVVKHAVVNPMPAPAPNLKDFGTSYEKVSALSEYFKRAILPLCDNYAANLPADARKREYEYKQLSEVVLAQVVLQADGIISNDETTRVARRELIKEAQSALNKIDAAFHGGLD